MGNISDRKVNVVGTLESQNVRKNPKKVTEKRECLRETSFRLNRFFYMVVNQKLSTVNTGNFNQSSNFYEICRKRENLQRNDNDLSSNDWRFLYNTLAQFFLLAFEFKTLKKFRPLKHKPPFSPTITENYILG
ncbi:Uncharacterized protein FWK35_00026934 [Aphis craccivora]|uniref:Uncharacterized protein n=1 Tax=Aphis craccivora TaxID=307492 RepID=A0A6G0Y0K6_APHCR|nr:Uncharacterized protein FWK35_00026934 [Aphis craccivora]